MAVRNWEKAHPGMKVPQRPVFRGDPAGYDHDPYTRRPGSRKNKPTYDRPTRKAPGELLRGQSRRDHSHPKDLKLDFKGQHCSNKDHARFVPLTKAHKKGG